jgi:DNA topoisomerase-3
VDKLQVLVSRKYGYKSDEILEAAQSLYERHKLTTYPRSDCQFLPVSQLADSPMVIDAVTSNLRFDNAVLSQVDSKRKSRAWNDEKVTAHHAIIPTTQKADLSMLSPVERDVYDEVCRRYLAQFMPHRRYRAVAATADVCGQHFVATGTTTISPGWRTIYGASTEASEDKPADEGSLLPPMKQGDPADCLGLDIEAKKTTPPKYFTDSTLLEAMVNIHKFVTDEKVKAIFMKMLADKKGGDEEGACGLGTPATRHTFVPKLIEVGLVAWAEPEKGKGGKKAKELCLVPSPAGVALYQALPFELAKPDMTALWETSMREIEAGRATVDRFLGMQSSWIAKTIDKIRSAPLTLPDAPGAKKKNFSSNGPRKAPEPAGKDCPECGSPLLKRENGRGPFLGCSSYPKCKHLEKVS